MVKNILLEEARIGWDSFDSWGSAISLHYAICDFMLSRGFDVPDEWEYSNPYGMVDDDCYDFRMIAELLDGKERHTQWMYLFHAGEVMHRYEAQLVLAGKDY